MTIYKVLLFVENDICSWIVQASVNEGKEWYTHSVSMKPFRSLDYLAAIEDASSYIFDKRYRVPVYHNGVKPPIDYLFEKGEKYANLKNEKSIRTKGWYPK